MTRGKRDKDRKSAERKCIATGRVLPKTQLVRFVVGPDEVVVPDLLEKLPGRGIWVSAHRAAISKAATKGLFARAAKSGAKASEDLADRVEEGLVTRVTDLVSLSRRSGRAIAGYEKVKGWLETDRARVLIQATDGSQRGKGKLRPPAKDGHFISVLSANELGLAFGRENVIHSALASGGLTDLVVEEAARLKGLRESNDGKSVGKDTKST